MICKICERNEHELCKMIKKNIIKYMLGIYIIRGIKIKKNERICINCIEKLEKEKKIKIDEYLDLECDLCKHKYMRMDIYANLGIYCATRYNEEEKKLIGMYGSNNDGEIMKIKEEFKKKWEDVRLNENTLICDNCIDNEKKEKRIKTVNFYL